MTLPCLRDDSPREPTNGCVTDAVYSPDDGGWYLHQYDFNRKPSRQRFSKGIYPTEQAAWAMLRCGACRWEKWS